MDMAERKGAALRRWLCSAGRLSEAAIFFGSFWAKTPPSRSSALDCRVTRSDQFLPAFFFALFVANTLNETA
jgi:hypothetical protein